jgi:AcrR family transcriptional regulator
MTFVMTHTPRDRMVQSAALLLMERGVAGTGMREIAEHAEAPRGSLQHYFPDGKDQVVVEALGWIAEEVTGSVTRQLEAGPAVTPRAVVAKQFGRWRKILESSDFLAGCPVMATLTDAAANDTLREAAARTFDIWREALTDAFRAAGLPKPRAERMALLLISSLEGAIAMSRAQRDIAPLETVGREMELLVRNTRR